MFHHSFRPAAGPPSSKESRGFSLVELMVAVTLIGVVLGFGLPWFSHFADSSALPGDTLQLSGSLKLARETAIARSQSYAVRVDTTNSRYQLFSPVDGSTTTWVSLHPSVKMTRISGTTPTTFVFDYMGQIASNGQVVLVSRAGMRDTIKVSLAGRVSTGRVS